MSGTGQVRDDIVSQLQDARRRIATLEQAITNPSVVGVVNPNVPVTVSDLTVGGVNLSAATDPVTGVVATTGSFLNRFFIDLVWTAPAGPDGTYSYEVQLLAHMDQPGYDLVSTQRTFGTSIRFDNLLPNTSYLYRVYSVNGLGQMSDPAPPNGGGTITTPMDQTVPSKVLGLKAAPGFNSASFTWNEVPDDDVAGGKGVYRLQYSTDVLFGTGVVQRQTSGTILAENGIAPGTYYVRVAAVDTTGNQGPWSDSVQFNPNNQLSDGQPPTTSPTATLVPLVGAMMVKWSPVTNVDPVTYDVHMSVSSPWTASAATLVGSTSATSYVVKTKPDGSVLDRSTAYFYRVVARDADGSAPQGPSTGSNYIGQATSADIAVGAITATNGIIASLDASKITVGQIDGSIIKAGSLTAKRVVIGDNSNVFVDGQFVDPKTASDFQTIYPDAFAYIQPPGYAPYGYCLAVDCTKTGASDRNVLISLGQGISPGGYTSYVRVNSQAKYLFAMNFRSYMNYNVTFFLKCYDANGSSLGSGPAVTWQRYSTTNWWDETMVLETVNNAVYAELIMTVPGGTTTGSFYIDDMELRPMTSGTTIVDGTISTNHISTVGLDASIIKFGMMSGDRILTGTLDAKSIKTSTLDASTITLTGTGALLAGSTTGNGLQLNAQGLRLFKNGSPSITLDAATGTGTFTGSITGSDISGSTITASTIQTATSGQRIALIGGTDVAMTIYPASTPSLLLANPKIKALYVNNYPTMYIDGGQVTSMWPSFIRIRGGQLILGLYDGTNQNTLNFGRPENIAIDNDGTIAQKSGYAWFSSDLHVNGGISIYASDLNYQTFYHYFGVSGATINGPVNMDGRFYFASNLATTSSAANVNVVSDTTNGSQRWLVKRVSSSLRYKTAVEDLEASAQSVLKLRPRTWVDRADADQDDPQRHVGLIAEEVAEAGLDLLLRYDEDGQPDALQYDRLPVYFIPLLQEFDRRIRQLERA